MNMFKPKTSRDPTRNLRPTPMAPVVRRRAQTLAQSLKVVVRQERPGASVAAPQIAKRLGAMAPIALRQLAYPSLRDRRDLRRLADRAALRKKPDHLKMRPLNDGVGRAKPCLEFVSRKMNNHPCHDLLRIMTTDNTRSNNPRESLSESFKRIPYDSQEMRDILRKRGLADGILWKVKHPRYPLETWQKYANHWAGRIRSAVERAPATMKRWYGMGRVRYLGLARNNCHLQFVATAMNMKRALVLMQEG